MRMLDHHPDTKDPKMGQIYPDIKGRKSGNSDLASEGIIRGPSNARHVTRHRWKERITYSQRLEVWGYWDIWGLQDLMSYSTQFLDLHKKVRNEGTTVHETQKQRLCPALPFEFGALSNIFWKESAYFICGLKILFLEGRWLCNVSNLIWFSKFQLKFSTICCIKNLHIG